jgi:hypothetical protein
MALVRNPSSTPQARAFPRTQNVFGGAQGTAVSDIPGVFLAPVSRKAQGLSLHEHCSTGNALAQQKRKGRGSQ